MDNLFPVTIEQLQNATGAPYDYIVSKLADVQITSGKLYVSEPLIKILMTLWDLKLHRAAVETLIEKSQVKAGTESN